MVDAQLIVNTLLYFFIFACGFAISIPIGITQTEIPGCILYGKLDPKSQKRFILNFSKKSNCDFPMYFGMFVCIIYASGMVINNLYAIYKSKKDPFNPSQIRVMSFILLNSLVTAVMFVSSCIVSAGFRELCDSLTQGKPYQYYSSCDKAENQKLVILGGGQIISMGHFYTNLNVTQAASWMCTFLWLALVISGIVRFKLNR